MASRASCESTWLRLFSNHTGCVNDGNWEHLGTKINLNRSLDEYQQGTLATKVVELLHVRLAQVDEASASDLVQACKHLLVLFQASHSAYPLHPSRNQTPEGDHLLATWVWEMLIMSPKLDLYPDLMSAAHEITQWLVGIRVFDLAHIDSSGRTIDNFMNNAIRASSCRGVWQTLAALGPLYNYEPLVSSMCYRLVYWTNWHSRVHAWWWLEACIQYVSRTHIEALFTTYCCTEHVIRMTSIKTRVRLASLFLSLYNDIPQSRAYENHPILCLLDAAATDVALAQFLSVPGRTDSRLGPLVWLDCNLVSTLADQPRDSEDAHTCARLLDRRWRTIDRPHVHKIISKHLIPDLANLVIDALESLPPCLAC
jgi:hypothetical protein